MSTRARGQDEDELSTRQREGSTAVWTTDGGVYGIALKEYAAVRDAFMAGRAFVETVGIYGQPITLKLAGVQGVGGHAPETWRRMAEDEDIEERQKKAKELL